MRTAVFRRWIDAGKTRRDLRRRQAPTRAASLCAAINGCATPALAGSLCFEAAESFLSGLVFIRLGNRVRANSGPR